MVPPRPSHRIFPQSMATLAALLLVPLLLLALAARPAAALETQARSAILIDAATGTVLFEKNAETQLPPASMSKIMTIYLVFERLADGRLSMDDLIPVSEKAWRMGGSKMWIEVGEQVRVEDLLRGVIVQSGNDAAIAFAEALSGSEEAFAQEMNKKAAELGLADSNFRNATGWPDPQHYMSARDLATLARRLILDFPQYYHFYSETEFTWADITQPNRNPLLGRGIGVDGIKTGHTEEAGYCLAVSAVQDGRRLILVVTGLPSEKARAEESERLLTWGFREFTTFTLFAAGAVLDEAPVFMGADDTVPLVAPHDLEVQMLRSVRDQMTVTLRYQAPIEAPIAEGKEVAILTVEAPNMKPIDLPVVAGRSVDELGVFGRIVASVQNLIGL